MIYFFEKTKKRREAISLVLFSAFCWAQIREISNIRGKDEDWLKYYLGKFITPIKLKTQEIDLFTNDKQIVRNLTWLFDIHSFFRHPKEAEYNNYKFIWDSECSDEISERLLSASKSLVKIMSVLNDELNKTAGWVGSS